MNKKQSQKCVYVVTRNQRRTEEKNYLNFSEAELRAEKLKSVLRQYDPRDAKRVSVIETTKPHRIR